jgi:hypothetical protein
VLATILLCSNGMVMAFDKKGQQVGEYQGNFKSVRDRLLNENINLDQIEFRIGSFGKGTVPMTKNQFFSSEWD